MDIMLDDGNTIKICTISNTLDYAKAQPRKPMKMPLPPLPNSSGAPALPPRRGVPPPPPPTEQADQEEYYDEFSDEQNYDDFDVEDTPAKPPFRPPAIPTAEPDENYDEFEGSASSPQSGPSIYMMDEETDAPPAPPPPSLAGRAKLPPLPKPPVHEEVEYMDPDEDENISAGSITSTGSSGPPVPGNRKPELPSRVEKPKKTGPAIFALDSSTLANVKKTLKNVGFSKTPEKKKEEDKTNIFGKPLKPVTPKKPDNPKPKENGSKSKPKPEIPKPEIPKPEIPKPPKPQITTPNVELKEKEEDDFEEQVYDDATSLLVDPLDVYKWYHGLINREETNKRLKSVSSDGAFLVRKSTKDKNHPYTLAVMYQNNIQNLKVRIRDDDKYALGEYKDNEVIFSSLPKVIEHHQKNDVILIGQKTGTVKLQKTPLKK